MRQLRLDLHLTQGDLSDACGLSSNAVISKVEQNSYKPTLDLLYKLAGTLNCTVGYLIGESELRDAPTFDARWRDFYKDFVHLPEYNMVLLSEIAKLMLKPL